jgi:hypothetical protein
MKRKTFIYLTVAAATALGVPIAGCRHYSDALINTLGQPDFLGHVCDAKTIGDIGSVYRTTFPEESQRTHLIRLLLKDIPRGQDDPRLPQLLESRVGQDFATNDIVTIKGWILSRTEARQCAIFSLNR